MKQFIAWIILLAVCLHGKPNVPKGDSLKTDRTAILNVIDKYAKAVNTANADSLESLFWLNDSSFSEVENCRALPFGKTDFLSIAEWIRQNGKPDLYQVFEKSDVYLLSNDIAYTVSIRKEVKDGTKSRITFIFLKKKNEWRIIHGHFSYMPKE